MPVGLSFDLFVLNSEGHTNNIIILFSLSCHQPNSCQHSVYDANVYQSPIL